MSQSHPVVQPILKEAESRMRASLDRLKEEFSSLRTGRASSAMVEHVKVDYYGAMTPLKQVAAVGVPDGRTIEIKPWDAATLPAIERAVRLSDMGLNPVSDGKLLRIVIPTLTEDRRREMVKSVKRMAEEFRVAIRNDRRDAMEKIKKAEKDKQLTEDDRQTAEHALQALTTDFVKRVDEALDAKERDILTV